MAFRRPWSFADRYKRVSAASLWPLRFPGLGNARPRGFTATKDAYATALADALAQLDGPLDVVGHDIGALLTLRIATAFELLLRSWIVDVANVFYRDHVWPDRVHQCRRTASAVQAQPTLSGGCRMTALETETVNWQAH